MSTVLPKKLRAGSRLRVISPSRGLAAINQTPQEHENLSLALTHLESIGLKIEFASGASEVDLFETPPLVQRLADLHQAFRDPDVDGIITSIGGFNANQLLPWIDYPLLAQNPKVFCGYSDITVLSGALLAKTNMVSYSGPHFSTFGMRDGIEYTFD